MSETLPIINPLLTSDEQCFADPVRMFLGLMDPDPIVRGKDPDRFIIKQKVRKTLIPTVV